MKFYMVIMMSGDIRVVKANTERGAKMKATKLWKESTGKSKWAKKI